MKNYVRRGNFVSLKISDVLSKKLAYADAHASQNLCVGFIFDAEQVCNIKIFWFENYDFFRNQFWDPARHLRGRVWIFVYKLHFPVLSNKTGQKLIWVLLLIRRFIKYRCQYFPKNVEMTSGFEFETQTDALECLCLCKTIDIPLWQGWIELENMRIFKLQPWILFLTQNYHLVDLRSFNSAL